jgi:hypothetical protein
VNCVEVIDLVGTAIEGGLPGEVRPDFDLHIAKCRPCRSYLEQLTATVRTLGNLPRPAAANPRRAELLERFRKGPGRSH